MTKLFADIMNLEKSKNPFHSFGWNKGMPDNSAISWQCYWLILPKDVGS